MMRAFDTGIGIFLGLCMFWGIVVLIPTSWWFEVRSVQVFDSVKGTSPRMLVDRSINRDFIGTWVATVYRIIPDGYEIACNAQGKADYSSENKLPVALDLDWWTWPVQCKLPVGHYVTRTTWTVDLFGLLTKDVRATSNPFEITDSKGAKDYDDS